jgi:hypothetical protein
MFQRHQQSQRHQWFNVNSCPPARYRKICYHETTLQLQRTNLMRRDTMFFNLQNTVFNTNTTDRYALDTFHPPFASCEGIV